MSAPAGNPGDGKGGREVLLGQADRLQHTRRVELDVGRLRTFRMLFVKDPERDLLDPGGELVELRIHAPAHVLQDRCPRVVDAVDAMAEAHELDLALAGVTHPAFGVITRAVNVDAFMPWSASRTR